MALIVVLFIISKGKRYCISNVGMGNIGVRQSSGQTQIQKSSRWESIGDFIRFFLGIRGGDIIKERLYAE